MTRRRAMGLLAAGAALFVSACGVDPDKMAFIWNAPYHAKLKVEVETPQGVRSGSSVIEVKWDKAGKGFNVRGEAVAVDLPEGQTLFVLLTQPYNEDWPAYLHENVTLTDQPKRWSDYVDGDGTSADQQEERSEYYVRIAADRTVWPVKRRHKWGVDENVDNYPYVVRFRDINDPKSVEQVDPDHLEKALGKGFKLKALTVQMVDEPVTVGIEKRLAWLVSNRLEFFDETRDPKSGMLEPPKERTIAHHLNDGSFLRKQ